MRKLVFAALMFGIMVGTGCRKVIDVRLNDAAQQVVIEGEINDGPGPYTIHITRTRNFSENNNFEQVSGALVIVRDVTGNISDTLLSPSAGIYRTSRIVGALAHEYQLTVTAEGKTFTASSTIPSVAVNIDSVYAGKSSFGGDDVYMTAQFRDPVGKGNYYRIKQYVRGIPVKGARVRGDEATDGILYRSQLFYDTGDDSGNPIIKLNDSITAELQCINRPVYDYFRTLDDVTGENSATPANPLSNIKGGALGIFNACTSRKKSAKAIF